jgi:hypothetical protein
MAILKAKFSKRELAEVLSGGKNELIGKLKMDDVTCIGGRLGNKGE